jgi:cystathionine gamma-synthase
MSNDSQPPRTNRMLAPETYTAQALGEVDPLTRGIVPPIHLSSTFERDADGGYSSGRGYGRPHNPSYDDPEALLTRLEGGAESMLLASGMAACTTVFQALLPGDHVIAPRVMYWALRKWLVEFAVPWGLNVEFVDMTSLDALARALRPGQTRLIWIETPANPTWDLTDIRACASLAQSVRARLVVDSTVASPATTRPLEHGADFVVHSASKYLNGHSDVIAGAIVCAQVDALWQRMKAWRRDGGAILGSFDSWLLLRGMRTLFVRTKQNSESALRIARHFEHHPLLKAVLYPGLESHSGHAIAASQMTGGYSGMLSIRHRDGEAGAMATAAAVEVFTRATSLGGVESLIEHRASIEGPATPVPFDLLRLSVGLEDTDDLIADLEQALARSVVDVSAADGHASETDAADTLVAPRDGELSVEERVREVVARQLRPLAVERGAELELKNVTDGVVRLIYSGSPGAVVTLVDEVRELVTHYVPEVFDVHIEGLSGEPQTERDEPLSAQIEAVLAASINPAVAAHGGQILLVETHGTEARLRMSGRCQGCALADVTFRQGVEVILRREVPRLQLILDTTDHTAGTDPYFKTSKG